MCNTHGGLVLHTSSLIVYQVTSYKSNFDLLFDMVKSCNDFLHSCNNGWSALYGYNGVFYCLLIFYLTYCTYSCLSALPPWLSLNSGACHIPFLLRVFAQAFSQPGILTPCSFHSPELNQRLLLQVTI
jgi:hypothetical protein